MWTKCLALLAVGFLLGADAKEDAAKEMKKLEGSWKVTATKVGGKSLPEKVFEGDRMVIKGNRLTMVSGEKKKGSLDFTFTIDPAKKPKHIDLTDAVMKKTVPCIYALTGDELTICIPLVEKAKGEAPKRPQSLDAKDKPQICFTAKREK